MHDRTSKSHLRTRSRRTRCSCASAAARRGRPAHRATRIADARQTLDTQWLNGVLAVLAGGLRPPARTLRLPRTTRPRFALPGAQRDQVRPTLGRIFLVKHLQAESLHILLAL